MTCPALTSLVRTCAGAGGLPSQRERLSAPYGDVLRNPAHPAEDFPASASVLSPTQGFQRKALNSTAAQLCTVPAPVQAALLLHGRRHSLLQRDSAHRRLRWICAELLPRRPDLWFSFNLFSQELVGAGQRGPQATG